MRMGMGVAAMELQLVRIPRTLDEDEKVLVGKFM